jgi:hypothetical protein
MTTIPHTRTRPAQRTRLSLAASFERSNVEAAHVILASPARYPGLMTQWAHAVIDGREAADRAWRLVG